MSIGFRGQIGLSTQYSYNLTPMLALQLNCDYYSKVDFKNSITLQEYTWEPGFVIMPALVLNL